MQRMSMTVIGMAIIFSLVAFAGCRALENQSTNLGGQKAAADFRADVVQNTDTVEIQGTVVYKDLEGGFYAIEGNDGRTYDPVNLPESFQTNGLRVKATVLYKNDVVGIHMAGNIVEIVHIEAQ